MVYLYLVYGLAFVGLGFVLALHARLPVAALPRDLLWLLVGFGLLHGVHEWIEMSEMFQLESNGTTPGRLLGAVSAVVLAASFALLLQFAAEWFIAQQKIPRAVRAIPGLLFLAWVYVLVAGAPPWHLGAWRLDWDEAAARWALGLPGALIAAITLVDITRPRSGELPAFSSGTSACRELRWAAGAFAVYAVVGGALIDPEPLFPRSPFGPWDGETATAAVLLVRTLCAGAIAVFLSHALVVETSKLNAEMARQRLHQEFIAVVAHDLRSWLSPIALSASVLDAAAKGADRSASERNAIQRIRSASQTLSRFVGDLLDASLIESREIPLELQAADLAQVVRDTVGEAAAMTQGHAVRISAPESVAIEIDPQRVRQVLMNLLSNAAKYSSPDTEILVEVEARRDEAVVSVTNAGAGIPQAELPKLFERYYRAQRAPGRGLGLGLYIADGIVAAHGGRIWAESEMGKSTTFRFTLPLRRGRKA